MITFDQTWSSAASTGGQAAVPNNGADASQWAMFARASTGAASTVAIQIAESTAGPWVTVASTLASTGTPAYLTFTGPLVGFIRAFSASTGATIRLVGVTDD